MAPAGVPRGDMLTPRAAAVDGSKCASGSDCHDNRIEQPGVARRSAQTLLANSTHPALKEGWPVSCLCEGSKRPHAGTSRAEMGPSFMKSSLSLAVGTVLFAALPIQAAQHPGLQGTWNIVSVPDGWKRVAGTSVLITQDEVCVCLGKLITTRMKYQIDPMRGTVDAIRTVKGNRVVQLGTYRREGDTLTLSVGAEGKNRPPTPDSKDRGAMRWVFKKVG